MMTTLSALRRYLPAESSASGATRVGSGFLDAWKTCRFLWYAEHVAPIGEGRGLVPAIDDEPLWVGKVFGAGLEGWFRSGWERRDYDTEAAIHALLRAAENERASAGFEDEWTRRASVAQTLLETYLRRAGPDDPHHFQVLAVDGEPLIEREFEVDLGAGLYFTSRPDLVVLRLSDEAVCALDHKTTSRPDMARAQMRKRSQLTGQQVAVGQVAEGARTGCIVNLVHKKPTRGGPVRTLENVDRAGARLELFQAHTLATLRDIDAALELYEHRCRTIPEPMAARLTFDDEPSDTACYRYNRPCRYLDCCIGATDVGVWHREESRARYTGSGREGEK